MNGLMIRPVGPFDHAIIASIHARSFAEAWGVGAIAELMAAPGAFGLLAAAPSPQGQEPAGFVLARVAENDCEILSLAVGSPHRRRGIARLLLQHATAMAVAAGATRLFLEVAEDNWAARRLYATLGFAPVGRRRGYYRRGQSTIAALTMRLLIRPGDRP
jgi:ribosomal-protein-alanine N-acetyltransferase